MRGWIKRIGLVVVVIGLMLGIAITPGVSMEKKEEVSVAIKNVRLEKVKGRMFKLTVKGEVPTAGWTVRLRAVPHPESPKKWIFEALGTGPDGVAAQVVTPWEAAVQLGLPKETREILVKGKNKTISQPVAAE